jgi:predicted small secreted protein
MIRPYQLKTYMWILILLMMVAIVSLSGCGTVAGFGSDIKDTADWTKNQIKKI